MLIAYVQIFEIKRITEITARAVDNTRKRLLLRVSLTEVTETIKIIEEIEDFLSRNDYDSARKKTNTLRDKLIQICNSTSYKKFDKSNDSNYFVRRTNDIQTSFFSATYFIGGEDEYDFENETRNKLDHYKIHAGLQEISALLYG